MADTVRRFFGSRLGILSAGDRRGVEVVSRLVGFLGHRRNALWIGVCTACLYIGMLSGSTIESIRTHHQDREKAERVSKLARQIWEDRYGPNRSDVNPGD